MEFKCSECGHICELKQNIERHIQTKCKNAEILKVPDDIHCEYCNKSFTTWNNMKKHIKICKEKIKQLKSEPSNIEIKELKNEIKKMKEDKNYEELKEKYEKLKEKCEKLEEELKEYKKLKMGSLNSIRAKARKKYTKYFELFCVHCKNSDKELMEICHIKPVSEFALDATEKDINALSNLISLCPNCHTGHDKLKNPEIIKTAKEHSEKILSLNIINN